jgi:hypothetical protein
MNVFLRGEFSSRKGGPDFPTEPEYRLGLSLNLALRSRWARSGRQAAERRKGGPGPRGIEPLPSI